MSKLLNYEYRVQSMGNQGLANVEYKTDKLGSITKSLYLPYDNPEAMRAKIVENFPIELFYSRWLAAYEPAGENLLMKSEGVVDLDDWFIHTCNGDS